ncbi:MAG: hypothetical protein MZV65_31025 [Chromatiales bacterium]|nr:hypothetical protein [Chromatiales bacterium]
MHISPKCSVRLFVIRQGLVFGARADINLTMSQSAPTTNRTGQPGAERGITIGSSRPGAGGEWSIANSTWLTFLGSLETGREFEKWWMTINKESGSVELDNPVLAHLEQLALTDIAR